MKSFRNLPSPAASSGSSPRASDPSHAPRRPDRLHLPRQKGSAHPAIIAELARVPAIADCGPIAARFIFALRLIALHERARRDPVPELAARLGGVGIAAKALALSQAIAASWPENIHVSRFCCERLTHDEASLASAIDAATACNRQAFEAQFEGLLKPAMSDQLWEPMLALIAAETAAR